MRLIKCFFFFLFLILAGCAYKPKINGFNKAPGYEKKITNMTVLYVASGMGEFRKPITAKEFKKLAIPFRNAGIKTDLYFYTGSKDDANQRMVKNEYLLKIVPRNITHVENTHTVIDITYNLVLRDLSIDKEVWIANMTVRNDELGKNIYEKYEEIGNTIFENMQNNNLI